MKQKLLKMMLLLCALIAGSSAWGQASVNDVMWAETWTGATTATSGSNSATPSVNYGKGTTVYNSGTVTYTQSANTVYVRNENLAGGDAPELMLSSGKTWTISSIPTGGATELTLTYKSNNTKSSVTCSTSGASISGTSKSYAITTGGAETITLVFSCSGNTRIDDVELKVKTAGATKSDVGTFDDIPNVNDATKGGSFDFDASDYYTDDLGVTGTTVLTVTPTSGDIYYSGGKIYTNAYGSQEFTVTATPSASDEASFKAVSTTFTVTCPDNRTLVNLTAFSATNTTLIVGGSPSTTATSASNDQGDWTAAYTYESSNTSVAKVDASGLITAVAKGTARITCSLNIDADDSDYKTGETTSKYVDITVSNPSHNAIFKTNGGTTYETVPTEEGEAIEFPDNPTDYSTDIVFVGWVTATINGSTDVEPTFVTADNMGNADVTFYACYAEKSTSESSTEKTLGLTTEDLTSHISNSYGSGSVTKTIDDVNYTVNIYACKQSSKCQLRAADAYIQIPTLPGNITNVSSTSCYNTSDNAYSGTIRLKSAFADGSTTTNDIVTKELSSVSSFSIDVTGSVTSFYLTTSAGLRLSNLTVTFEVDGSITTYSGYCTTVSALPKPVITLSTTSIDMTWGDTDKVLTATAKIGEDDFDGTITMTSSDPTNLTIDGSGNICCNVPGNYTITASIAAKDAEYQAANDAVCSIAVGKQDATVSFAEATIQKLISDGTYTQVATKSPAGAGDLTYTISPSGNTINSSTGEVTISTTGNYTVTATAATNTLYNEASGSYTLQVRKAPTISVDNVDVTYGNTYNVENLIEGGAITLTSSNTAVATASGSVITLVAVGSTAITVETAADDNYLAGSETFTLNVTAPAGKTTAKPTSDIMLFHESFDKSTSSSGARDWNNSYSEKTGVAEVYSGISSYTVNNVKQGKDGTGSTGAGLNQSPQGSVASIIIGPLNVANYSDMELTYMWNAGSIGSTYSTSASYATSADGVYTALSGTGAGATSYVKRSYTLPAAAQVSTLYLKIEWNTSNTVGRIDEVDLSCKPSPITTKLNDTYGYATFCSEYPLDFSDYETADYSAWQITGVSGTKILFEQITGSVKGGTGIFLMGESGETVTLTSADSENVLSGNKLFGTTAPTLVGADEYYGLKADEFKKVNAGTVPAGKALLPMSADVKSFTFVFNGADGIQRVEKVSAAEAEAIFNLAGQRIQKPQRGINIVNGRKVVVK